MPEVNVVSASPGGLVKEAASAAGEFLPRGAVVYTQEGRRADLVDTGRVGRSFWSSERRYPMAVLINAGTASAAELVAGALQDHDRAVVVGRPSFGKSLLMQGFPLSDGSALYLVVGRVRTPCGRVIQRQYHGLTRGDYYRLAAAERDTAGRPSCRTDAGRTVYGGGEARAFGPPEFRRQFGLSLPAAAPTRRQDVPTCPATVWPGNLGARPPAPPTNDTFLAYGRR